MSSREIGWLTGTILCILIKWKKTFSSKQLEKYLLCIRDAHSVTKTSLLGNFGLKFLFTSYSRRHFSFHEITQNLVPRLYTIYSILVLFLFQIAPLIVIVSVASLGAIGFGIRQATKNPEAWYVSTVFILNP